MRFFFFFFFFFYITQFRNYQTKKNKKKIKDELYDNKEFYEMMVHLFDICVSFKTKDNLLNYAFMPILGYFMRLYSKSFETLNASFKRLFEQLEMEPGKDKNYDRLTKEETCNILLKISKEMSSSCMTYFQMPLQHKLTNIIKKLVSVLHYLNFFFCLFFLNFNWLFQ